MEQKRKEEEKIRKKQEEQDRKQQAAMLKELEKDDAADQHRWVGDSQMRNCAVSRWLVGSDFARDIAAQL